MIDSGINSAKWHEELPGLNDGIFLVRERKLLGPSSFRELILLGHEAHFKIGIFVNLETHNIRVLFADYNRTDHESIKFNKLNGERFYGAEMSVSKATLNNCSLTSRNGGVDAVPPDIKRLVNESLRVFFDGYISK